MTELEKIEQKIKQETAKFIRIEDAAIMWVPRHEKGTKKYAPGFCLLGPKDFIKKEVEANKDCFCSAGCFGNVFMPGTEMFPEMMLMALCLLMMTRDGIDPQDVYQNVIKKLHVFNWMFAGAEKEDSRHW